MNNSLAERLADITARIEKAARSVGRDPTEVQLVAVSKTHPTSAIKEVHEQGIALFGENKVQQAELKIADLSADDISWHLIGHLQSNKARKAVQLFDVIQSLDSVDLAERLERICKEVGRSELQVFIEVDLAGEETKNGIKEELVPDLVKFLQNCECLKLSGLMVLPPYFEDPEATRPYFQRLRNMRDKLWPMDVFGKREGELSMGMSHDFEVAIQEGATLVRVGTAIFGERPVYP